MTLVVETDSQRNAEGGRKNPPDVREDGRRTGGLRLGVLGGGCSGLSYQFKFDTKPRPKDKVFDFDGVQIFVDPKSILYLHGMTLDYKESLMQSGFVFENPNAKKSCGCGTSFSAVTGLFRVFRICPGTCAIDPKDLEKRFYALSRKLHPDLHSRKSPAEREQARGSDGGPERRLPDPARSDRPRRVPAEARRLRHRRAEHKGRAAGAARRNLRAEHGARRGRSSSSWKRRAQRFEGMRTDRRRAASRRSRQWDATRDREALTDRARPAEPPQIHHESDQTKANVPDRV